MVQWLAIPENREFKKWKFSFFHQRHALSTSFDIFVVTYRVTNFLPKLVNIYGKLNFHFWFSPIFGLCPVVPGLQDSTHVCTDLEASFVKQLGQGAPDEYAFSIPHPYATLVP